MNCHQWNLPEFIHPVKSAALFIYLFIFLAAVDVVSVLIAGCCETVRISPAHIWHPWSSEVSLRHRFFKALKYFFPPFLFYFFFWCAGGKDFTDHFKPFLAEVQLVGDYIDSSAAKRNRACQTGNRWRGDRGEGGWWGRWEGTRDDQHLWELFEFLLQHHRIWQPHWGPFKRPYKNSLINLHHISKPLAHTTRHTLATIWLIADDLARGGPGLVWLHAVCGCEAAKFSKMTLETVYGREMTIQFRGNSSGGHSCRQRATCTLPPYHICVI